MKRKKLSKQAVARIYGYRSGLEHEINELFATSGVQSEYEKLSLKYTKPATIHKYTPDFYIENSSKKSFYIETKGRWLTQDRQKMRLIREQYPDLDIRIIFQNAEMKISKTSKTTYGQIATKLGFQWCDYRQGIPESWMMEFAK